MAGEAEDSVASDVACPPGTGLKLRDDIRLAETFTGERPVVKTEVGGLPAVVELWCVYLRGHARVVRF